MLGKVASRCAAADEAFAAGASVKGVSDVVAEVAGGGGEVRAAVALGWFAGPVRGRCVRGEGGCDGGSGMVSWWVVVGIVVWWFGGGGRRAREV